jgi:hypothetical protein
MHGVYKTYHLFSPHACEIKAFLWSRLILWNVIVPHLIKKIPAIYGNPKICNMSVTAWSKKQFKMLNIR